MSAHFVISARPVSLMPPKDGIAWPSLWLHRLRHRRALSSLDPDQIREAGLDPFVIRDEILKPLWRP